MIIAAAAGQERGEPVPCLMLPYESAGLWIWLGDWKVGVATAAQVSPASAGGPQQTDERGWQYAKVRLGAVDVPQVGWLPNEAAGTNVRRRLHWRFRQRLAALGGFRDKLETADWATTRTVSKVLTRLDELTADDTPLDRKELWTAAAMNPMQLAARQTAQQLMFDTESGARTRTLSWNLVS